MAEVKPAKPKPKPPNDGARQLRASGLSLKQIGDAAGASKPAVAEWLSGKSCPRGERLVRLVAAGFVTDDKAFERAPGAPRPPPTPAPPQDQAAPAPVGPPVPEWLPGAAAPAMAPPQLPPRGPEPPPPAPYEPSDVDLEAPGAARALVVAQLKRLQADTARLRQTRASDVEIRSADVAALTAAARLAMLAG